jgi:iron only hydrogenase large subunit-like protein
MSCPYGAIHKSVVPCEDACPVNAITKDENGKEQIDVEKCISCGKCLQSCPFGAISYNSQMIDVLNALSNPAKKVVAMVAPAILGQFGNDLGKVIAAYKALGFDDVIEVAYGADFTSKNESAEFVERMEEGAPFMTTSCCPAYVKTTKVHVPEIAKFVSNTGSPMFYAAEVLKKRYPDAVSVFVGPCLAKRIEAESNPNVDYVLVFADIQAMFDAKAIDLATLDASAFADESSLQSRRYAISGGVAAAVANLIDGKADYRPLAINGLTKDSVKALKKYALKGLDDGCNMLEVMCCEGGCIAGPGCVCMPKKAAVVLEKYAAEGRDQKELL